MDDGAFVGAGVAGGRYTVVTGRGFAVVTAAVTGTTVVVVTTLGNSRAASTDVDVESEVVGVDVFSADPQPAAKAATTNTPVLIIPIFISGPYEQVPPPRRGARLGQAAGRRRTALIAASRAGPAPPHVTTVTPSSTSIRT